MHAYSAVSCIITGLYSVHQNTDLMYEDDDAALRDDFQAERVLFEAELDDIPLPPQLQFPETSPHGCVDHPSYYSSIVSQPSSLPEAVP